MRVTDADLAGVLALIVAGRYADADRGKALREYVVGCDDPVRLLWSVGYVLSRPHGLDLVDCDDGELRTRLQALALDMAGT